MNELRLVFHLDPQAGTSLKALPVWPDAIVPQSLPFNFSLDDDDFEDLRWYLEDFMDLPDGGAVVRAESIEARLRDWGRRLHDAIFASTENQKLLDQLLKLPQPRVLTIGTADPALLRLPWELIADEAGPLAHRLSVRRQLETPEALLERPVVLPLRILYIVSRPGDTGFIDPRVTAQSVLDALDPLGASVQIDFCRPPTVSSMEALLREAEHAGDPYDLVHFDGHGTFDADTQLGALLFEKSDGDAETDLVGADRLGEVLAAHHVPLVILEACRSASVGRTAVFRSIAPRLIQAGVSSVLSMGHAVHVEAARLLLDRFYRELVRGTTIGQAVAQARLALHGTPGRWIEYGPNGRTIPLQDWFLPHLYQRGLDEPILPPAVAASASTRPRKFDLFLSHNHADSGRVEHLARLLVEKHGLRVWLDKWECRPGRLEPQCESGIKNSRYTVVVGSEAALKSKWVEWEIQKAFELNPVGARVLPIKFESLTLPEELDALLWVDFTDSARDEIQAALLAQLIRSSDAEDARQRRGFRSPTTNKSEVGAFPPAPLYEFQGRARELHELERHFRSHRGVVLHAMGGMGKTALATEAAHWWTRSGLFRDGACFVSFEQFASAERVEQVIGTYLEGPGFESLPSAEQCRRAIELFNEKDVLVVWDNFESVLAQFNEADNSSLAQAGAYTADERERLFELFRDLIADENGCGRLLVTCRPGETELPGALKMELQGLARPDSLWLLSRVIAKDGLTLNDPRLAKERVNPLLDMLADHPLSIELVAPYLKKLTPEGVITDFAKLLAEFRRGTGVERNESLLASLAFSTRRLSEAAQAALPWLGMFRVGVFEDSLLDISQLDPERWESVRDELEATALIRVERDILLSDRPYLRFHPTLVYASLNRAVPDPQGAEHRFIQIYFSLMRAADQVLRGSNARMALVVLAREEANLRAAIQRITANQHYEMASLMSGTFQEYLERSGRLRERDVWVRWLAEEIRKGGFSRATVESERAEAWTLFTQGHSKEAIRRLENLISRLESATDFDNAYELALTQLMLCRILYGSGLSEQSIPLLKDTVKRWEALVASGSGGAEGNLAATVGSLSNALTLAGHFDEALRAAERGLAMLVELGRTRDVAVGLGQCAGILLKQGRYEEAQARYDDALSAAIEAGDKSLEGSILQHKGNLADVRQQYGIAIGFYRQALKLFQEMNDDEGVMQTCNLLGVVESRQGRLSEARSWYERSLEIAKRRNDLFSLAAAAQNIGITFQQEGDAAQQRGREQEARQLFEEAKLYFTEGLHLSRQLDTPSIAQSLTELAGNQRSLGELDEAESSAFEALEIYEHLGLREVYICYHELALIAHARGDDTQAAEWERKCDAVIEEWERQAR